MGGDGPIPKLTRRTANAFDARVHLSHMPTIMALVLNLVDILTSKQAYC